MNVILTVDVEEWFHVCRAERAVPLERWDALEPRLPANMRRVLAWLAERDARATFLFVGWVAERYPDLVRTVDEAGHAVGLHGWSHTRADDLGPERFRADLRRCRAAVARALGRPLGAPAFRAPEWSIGPGDMALHAILAEEGIGIDMSFRPLGPAARWNPHPHTLETAAGPLAEYPVASTTCMGMRIPFGGGLPLRVLPMRMILHGCDALASAGAPLVLCLHPWEFDPAPPPVRIGGWRARGNRFGVTGLHDRLDGLLRGLAACHGMLSFVMPSAARRYRPPGRTPTGGLPVSGPAVPSAPVTSGPCARSGA